MTDFLIHFQCAHYGVIESANAPVFDYSLDARVKFYITTAAAVAADAAPARSIYGRV